MGRRVLSSILSSYAVLFVAPYIALANTVPMNIHTYFPSLNSIGPYGTFQEALKAGDTFSLSAFVLANQGLIMDADLSSLGLSNVSTNTANGPYYASINGLWYPNVFAYNLGPFVLPPLADGVKEISMHGIDQYGNEGLATTSIIIDNTPPLLTLSNITFSTTSPQKGDYMYLSGKASGTGSTFALREIRETLWDVNGNPIWGPLGGINYNNKDSLLAAIASSTDGTFNNVAFVLNDSPSGALNTAVSFKLVIKAYDGAGNTASTSLIIPIPRSAPVDPCVATNSCTSNVLFLPGIEASRLAEDMPCSNGICSTKLWEPNGDVLASRLAHDANGASINTDIYATGIIDNAYVPIKGNIYKSFIEQMNNLVAAGTINAWEAIPYDWRLSLDQILNSGSQIAPGKISYLAATSSPYIIQELKRLAATAKSGKVTIIAHSNGGLLTKRLLEKIGPDAANLIDKVVFVAVPQVGTPQAVGALLHGYDQGLPTDFTPYTLSDSAARTLAKNMPMAYNLVPSAGYFAQVTTPAVSFSRDSFLTDFRNRYGTSINSENGLHMFMTDLWRAASSTTEGLNYPSVGNDLLFSQANVLHSDIDNWTPPTGVQLYEIAGWGEKTLAGIDYYQGISMHCDSVVSVLSGCVMTPKINYRPRIVLDGDRTVLTPSALWTPGAKRYWVDLKTYNGFFGTIKHASILEVPQLRTFLQTIITNNNNGSLPQYISTSTPINPDQDTELHFVLHSPLSLNLYDATGRHTGISTTTGELEENIPGSKYLKFGEVQFISVPASLHASLVMNGYAAGSFTLDAEEARGETVIASTTFAGIPSITGAVAAMDIPSGGIANMGPLTVDENNDGRPEISLQPKEGSVITPDVTPPEIRVSFDTSTKSIAYLGLDDMGSTTVSATTTYSASGNGRREKEYNRIATTTVTALDDAGNTTVLTYTRPASDSERHSIASVVSISYNGISTRLPAVFEYKWNTNKKGEYTMSVAYLETASSTIEAHYRPNKNITVIMIRPQELSDHEDDEDSRPIQSSFPGLVVPGLQTEKGSVKVIY